MQDALNPIATYEEAKQIAQHGSWKRRAALAADRTTAPELLVFLAADSSEGVRHALAGNPALPSAAAKILARDTLDAVRQTLAQEAGRLWTARHANDAASPEATLAKEALAMLAIDEAATVRTALSTAIAEVAMLPRDIAETLAVDAVETVAVPILRHYADFSDDYLIGLMAKRSEPWARRAFAQRKTLSMALSAALLKDESDLEMPGLLLGNAGAQFGEPAWESFSMKSQKDAKLLGALARRADLPRGSAAQLAAFVDDAIFDVLATRPDFDRETRAEIVAVARRRVDWIEREKAGKLPPVLRVRELFDAGKLGDDAIRDALALRDGPFIRIALSIMGRIYPEIVDTILKSESPKAITALAWRAGLSARTALALQKNADLFGGKAIEPHRLLHPRGGSDYALTEPELLWQLEFYGVKV